VEVQVKPGSENENAAEGSIKYLKTNYEQEIPFLRI
jgi:hypothetical protein